MKKLLFRKEMLCSGNLILCRLAKCCDASIFALAAKFHVEPHDVVRSSVAARCTAFCNIFLNQFSLYYVFLYHFVCVLSCILLFMLHSCVLNWWRWWFRLAGQLATANTCYRYPAAVQLHAPPFYISLTGGHSDHAADVRMNSHFSWSRTSGTGLSWRETSRTIYHGRTQNCTVDATRRDTRCSFNVRTKADLSQLNLPHGINN